MIDIEIDNSGIYRLKEIKENRLHNYPKSWSGFLTDVVVLHARKPVTMAYILNNKKLIGWAYLRDGRIVDNRVIYDAGSFVNRDYRNNGYATMALKKLVEIVRSKSNKIIEIKAQSGTKSILESFKEENIKISEL